LNAKASFLSISVSMVMSDLNSRAESNIHIGRSIEQSPKKKALCVTERLKSNAYHA
jgi:hypothetical protein